MNKSKRNLVIIGLLLIFFTFIAFQLEPKVKTVSREDVTSVKVNSEKIESDIQLKSEIKEAKSFTSSVTLPFSEKEAIDVPIKAWAIGKENAFFDEMEQNSFLLGNKMDAHFSIETEVIKVKDNLFSFILTIEQLLDSENQYAEMKTFVVDLKEETIINVDDILKMDAFTNEKFITNLFHSIDHNKFSEEEFQAYIEVPEHIQWIVTKEKMVFYFKPFGNKENFNSATANIEYKQLKDFLTKRYKNIFIPEKTKSKPKDNQKNHDGKKRIAITFDDGPDADITPQILQTLKEHQVKATFFMLSKNVKANPEIAKQLVADGHEAANHSISHVNLNTVKKSRIMSEIIDSKNVIADVTGTTPTLFRPPYGEFNQTVINIANDSEQAIIMWSVDPLDWKYRNAKKIYENIISRTTDGSIILLHDIHQTTADALPNVLSKLKEDGYEFLTITELLPHISGDDIGPHYGK